jgi:aspartyl protease family protein
MDSEQAPHLIYAALAAMLVLSSLIAQRLPMQRIAKMLFAWLGIFALAFIVFSFRPEMAMMWQRVKGELTGAPRQQNETAHIRLTRQDDGHFWVRAQVNGNDIDFMVDSGATTTAINATSAREADVDVAGSIRTVELDTANGIVNAKQIELESFKIGEFEISGHDVVVAENFGETNVVGMNFLDAFESWNVSGEVMTLIP